jgi:hypothetical protein
MLYPTRVSPLILIKLAAYTLHTCFEDVAFLGRVKAKEHDIPEISTTCLEAKLGGSLFQEHALKGHCSVYRTIKKKFFFFHGTHWFNSVISYLIALVYDLPMLN